MNGRSRFRVIPEETQQAGVPLSPRVGFILIQLSSECNPTAHPGKPEEFTAFQCTGKQIGPPAVSGRSNLLVGGSAPKPL